jgi:hypothetical protein
MSAEIPYFTFDENYDYYLCYFNKEKRFIFKTIKPRSYDFLFNDFIPDNAKIVDLHKNIPYLFYASTLKDIYNRTK